MSTSGIVEVPNGPFLGPNGRPTLEWLTWLINGNVTNTTGSGITVTHGTTVAPTHFTLGASGVVAGTYGAADSTFLVSINDQGQWTAVSLIPIAIVNTQVSGLGTMSVQDADAVAITGGSVEHILFSGYSENVTSSSAGATQTIDYSLSNVYAITLTQNCTFSISNWPLLGGSMTLYVIQGGSGSYTVTWPSEMTGHWIGGTAPTLSTAVGTTDVITLVSHDGGTTIVGSYVGAFT